MAVTGLPAIILDINLAQALPQDLLDPLLIIVKLSFCNYTYSYMGDIGLYNFDGGVKIVKDISKVFIIGG